MPYIFKRNNAILEIQLNDNKDPIKIAAILGNDVTFEKVSRLNVAALQSREGAGPSLSTPIEMIRMLQDDFNLSLEVLEEELKLKKGELMDRIKEKKNGK